MNSKASSTIQKPRRGRGIAWKTLLTLGIVLALAFIGSFKAGYHVDEMLTFGLSNYANDGSFTPDIKDGVVYTGQQLWQEYTMVSDSTRFDYANVVNNQIHDVHPPLYYFLVHTVFSLFPNTYSKWYAMAVNIALAVVVFWQMVWLFQFFIKRKKLSVLFALLFIFTTGFVNSMVFFRMYVLLTVWTNALVMLFCKYMPEDVSWKYYALLVLILTGGTMTQYYFLVFAFFACVVYAIRVTLDKNWKKLGLSCLSVALSVGISTLLFPAMWQHIFNGYRGTEAFENLSSDGFLESLEAYLDILNLQVFGNLFVVLFLIAVVLCFVGRKNINRKNVKQESWKYLQLVIPAVCYIVIIAQISPYKTDRYVMNIMGILYLLVFGLLIHLVSCCSRQAMAGILAAAFLVLIGSYQRGVPYLYVSEKDNVMTIENIDNDVTCLYLSAGNGKILPNYTEIENLDKIVFLSNDNLELLDDDAYKSYDKLLLYVTSTLEANQLINQILEQNPEMSSSTELFTQGYATAYYLE